MSDHYSIADEPTPSALERLAVRPLWPLFAMMFAGAWLAWPWFLVNSHAIGSPFRNKEAKIIVAGIVGALVIVVTFVSLRGANALSAEVLPYVFILLTSWKLFISYWLYTLQERTIDLYEHFGGTVRNGLMVVIAGVFLRLSFPDPVDGLGFILYVALIR